jgi:hypothetical protein
VRRIMEPGQLESTCERRLITRADGISRLVPTGEKQGLEQKETKATKGERTGSDDHIEAGFHGAGDVRIVLEVGLAMLT